MNENSSKCPKCGGTVEIATAQGLCPKCLLAAVALPTETGATSQRAMVLPTLHEVAAAFPHLEIVEVIGQGGMGIVFKARQPKLDRLVALKILPLMLAADPAFAERFTREGRVLARLNHPNIVTVHDFGQTGGFFYLLMEFVDGANLRQAMQAGRFTPEQALAVVPKVCEALQYAHNEGILHRDIKPENILLDAKGRVKIADFGIAKLVGEPMAEKALTGSGARLGTPHYMAPEQVERPSEVDHRADIYSLGVVFYEMLTGELPLGRFAAPSEKSKSDPRLDEVVFSTLQKEPSRRTQSAAEVKTQVENITGTVAMGEAPRTSTPPGGNLPMSKASACYLSTPEHLASMAGQWNLYKARGGLKLDGTNLAFVHDWHGVTIPLRAIRDLSIGHYPWVMKPTRLDFICVTFEENGTLRRLLFTPHESRWMPTWETNQVVAEWFTAIREAVVRVTGRAPTSTPAAQLQIPEPRGWQRAAFAALVMVPFVLFLCVGSLALLRGDGALNPRMFIPLALVAGFAGAIVWIWSRQRRHGKTAAGGYHSPGGAFLLLTVMGIGIALGLIFLISIRPAPRTPPPPAPEIPAPSVQNLPRRLDELQQAAASAQIKLTELEVKYAALKKLNPAERREALVRLETDGRLAELNDRLNALKQEFATKQNVFGAEHPEMVSLIDRIKDMEQQIALRGDVVWQKMTAELETAEKLKEVLESERNRLENERGGRR